MREEVQREQLKFYGVARFPKAVGAMDCTHIRINSLGKLQFIVTATKNYNSVGVITLLKKWKLIPFQEEIMQNYIETGKDISL